MKVMARLDTIIDFLLRGSMSGLLFVLLPKLFLFGPRPPPPFYFMRYRPEVEVSIDFSDVFTISNPI